MGMGRTVFVTSRCRAPVATLSSARGGVASFYEHGHAVAGDAEFSHATEFSRARFEFDPRAKRGSRMRNTLLLASITDGATRTTLGMRAIFDEIDHNQDGLICESDLLAFTNKRALPSEYVREFMLASGARSVEKGVNFKEFARFVHLKESALRRSFEEIGTCTSTCNICNT
jgi:hypothetical protein